MSQYSEKGEDLKTKKEVNHNKWISPPPHFERGDGVGGAAKGIVSPPHQKNKVAPNFFFFVQQIWICTQTIWKGAPPPRRQKVSTHSVRRLFSEEGGFFGPQSAAKDKGTETLALTSLN